MTSYLTPKVMRGGGGVVEPSFVSSFQVMIRGVLSHT